jgi:hypothetical protein
MSAPDYRKAACCGNCYYMSKTSFNRCVRYGGKVDMLDTCAGFSTEQDIERAFNGD